MMPIVHVLRKFRSEYKLTKLKFQSPNIHRRNQSICQKRKRIRRPNRGCKIFSQDMRMKLGIEECAILIMSSGKDIAERI